jgi:quinolinate synthase
MKSIEEVRKEFGKRLVILGHHYQDSDVLKYCDFAGDSLALSKIAGECTEAEKIVFCGVKFMAESADTLTSDEQVVYMPDISAGCPMALMATAETFRAAMASIRSMVGDVVIPLVYVNSTVGVKAVCGENGGATCTSGNARKMLQWVFDQGKKVLFLPDQQLGTNIFYDMGILDSEMKLYDPALENGGLTAEDLKVAKLIAWKGFCCVHNNFTVADVERARKEHPNAKIIVHPETPKEVTRLCDAYGSTAEIIKMVETFEDGSDVVIGTESNLVNRLAEQYKGKVNIFNLAPSYCKGMRVTTEENLQILLNYWPDENIIKVDSSEKENARKALEQMFFV